MSTTVNKSDELNLYSYLLHLDNTGAVSTITLLAFGFGQWLKFVTFHTTTQMLNTPLYNWHLSRSARMVEFGGWAMPVQYSSVIEEHNATRNAIGLTDVSHMGRFTFDGGGACAFLDSVLSRDVTSLKLGQIRYSFVLNENAGILDDVLIGMLARENQQPYYLLVVNASNRDKIKTVIENQLAAKKADVTFADNTESSAMLALQGAKAVELLEPYVVGGVKTLKYYNGKIAELRSPLPVHEAVITRTGYTGEDGFEITVPANCGGPLAETLRTFGEPFGLKLVGLGARDTLRLEAGMPLYGHELSETVNPFEAGLAYACCLDGADYTGRDALRRIANLQLERVRVGIAIEGRKPAREGCPIIADGKQIGITTSGSYSPTLDRPIAMGFVSPEYSSQGQMLQIDIRGKISGAVVVPLPFYNRQA
ncbi:MAG: glycine cleavage system aminomethyltransferase GcvT [Planctomycetaceae bacterium]|jgi:aminomethyltransferase|nr:glycine cleavage system aminomethyltransferase GcvT [Planctomycetaceae bacterium]